MNVGCLLPSLPGHKCLRSSWAQQASLDILNEDLPLTLRKSCWAAHLWSCQSSMSFLASTCGLIVAMRSTLGAGKYRNFWKHGNSDFGKFSKHCFGAPLLLAQIGASLGKSDSDQGIWKLTIPLFTQPLIGAKSGSLQASPQWQQYKLLFDHHEYKYLFSLASNHWQAIAIMSAAHHIHDSEWLSTLTQRFQPTFVPSSYIFKPHFPPWWQHAHDYHWNLPKMTAATAAPEPKPSNSATDPWP